MKEIGRRRNGKQQACEPCRISKQSCSHTLPHCDRCVKRGTTSKCHYHPAPMTAGYNGSVRDKSSPATSTKRTLSLTSPSPISSPKIKALKERADSPNLAPTQSALFQRGPVSSGPTSYSAIIRENRQKFGKDFFESNDGSAINSIIKKRWRDNSTALNVLASFPSKSTCDYLRDSYSKIKDPKLPLSVIRAVISSIWTTWRDQFESEDEAKLVEILDVLYANERPWSSITDSTFGDWPDICCGQQLRWEMLGLVFTFFGMAFMQLQEWDDIFKKLDKDMDNRRKAAARMKRCADTCLSNAEASGALNEVVVNLKMEIMLLESFCIGDEDIRIVKRHAELAAVVMYRGLHKLAKPVLVTPATEYQKRVFMQAYDTDKSLCCFLGRPPLISEQYCFMRLPLDLSDEQLISSSLVLDEAIQRLDKHGWNTDGKIHETTTARARIELSRIKEEILDISLRTKPVDPTKLDEVLASLETTMATFPSQLRYSDKAPNHGGPQGQAFYSQAVVRLHYLQIKFYVERMRMYRKNSTSQTVFDVCKDIMVIINELYSRKDELLAFNQWFDWILVNFGANAAGVLALTLITFRTSRSPYASMPSSQQTSQPQSQTLSLSQSLSQPPPSSQMSTLSTATTGTRGPRNPHQLLSLKLDYSATIELLTHYLAFLKWSRETDGNHITCVRLFKIYRGIVDQLMRAPPPPFIGSSQNMPGSADSSFGGPMNPPMLRTSTSFNSATRSANSSFPGENSANDDSYNNFGSSLTTTNSNSDSKSFHAQAATPTNGLSFEGLAGFGDDGILYDPKWDELIDNVDFQRYVQKTDPTVEVEVAEQGMQDNCLGNMNIWVTPGGFGGSQGS